VAGADGDDDANDDDDDDDDDEYFDEMDGMGPGMAMHHMMMGMMGSGDDYSDGECSDASN
jgi:hypothetical protein